MKVVATGHEIKVTNHFATANRGIERIEFADGTIWNLATINANAPIRGSDSAETLNGSSGDDTIDGLGGNDTLNGNGGNDTSDRRDRQRHDERGCGGRHLPLRGRRWQRHDL